MAKHYDIIINGGGIVGFTLLNIILKSPRLNRLNVLLIEQASKPTQKSHLQPRYQQINDETKVKFSNRVSSITPQSRNLFKKLGVWQRIEEFTKDIQNIEVWNYDIAKKLTFSGKDTIGESLFTVVENDRLASSLLDNIDDERQGEIIWAHNLSQLQTSQESPGTIEVIIDDKTSGNREKVTGCLVLGCDGVQSKIRDIAKIAYKERDLFKRAVVGTVRMSNNYDITSNSTAYQRFSNNHDTVIALLPLDKEYSSFVISAPIQYANHLKDCNKEEFILEVNKLLSDKERCNNVILDTVHRFINTAVQNTIDRCHAPTYDNESCPYVEDLIPDSRASFPLYFGTTSPKMIAPFVHPEHNQIALVGDAAHRVHPLAGQGLNLGIQDASVLANELEQMCVIGENPFTPQDLTCIDRVLKKYQYKRQSTVIPMSLGIMSMPLLFRLLPESFISNINNIKPIKNGSIKFASGFS